MTPERATVILRTMAGDWMETIMPEYLDEFCNENGFEKEELNEALQYEQWEVSKD